VDGLQYFECKSRPKQVGWMTIMQIMTDQRDKNNIL